MVEQLTDMCMALGSVFTTKKFSIIEIEGLQFKSFKTNIYLFISFIVVMVGGTWCHSQGYYNVSNISYMNSPPQLFLIPLPSKSWSSFNRCYICMRLYVYTFFVLSSPFYPFPQYLPPPTGVSPHSCSLIL
jgi:hypothetical protein